jgi:predicted ABC-type ATPase
MSEAPSTLRVIIIAGPNGAGKTTFAREFLPHEADCPVFVNADLIAAGLAPFAPESVAVQVDASGDRASLRCARELCLRDDAGAQPILLDWSDKA